MFACVFVCVCVGWKDRKRQRWKDRDGECVDVKVRVLVMVYLEVCVVCDTLFYETCIGELLVTCIFYSELVDATN